jgi:hypothetical protein
VKNDTFNKTVNRQAIETQLSTFVYLVYGNFEVSYLSHFNQFVCNVTCVQNLVINGPLLTELWRKKLKTPTDPSSRTRAWPPSVLILRGLCPVPTCGSCMLEQSHQRGYRTIGACRIRPLATSARQRPTVYCRQRPWCEVGPMSSCSRGSS